MSRQITTAYETCPRCKGSGMQDYGYSIGECYECNGNTVVRARDKKGRFTKIPVPEVQPNE